MERNNILLSIIIPVYNTGPLLCNCLDSIKNKRNIEVVVVNDGSTDSSLEIIKKYSNSFDNFELVDKKNEGVSVARNIGLSESNGEYVFFLDSDDFISSENLDLILSKLKSNKDIYQIQTNTVNENKIEDRTQIKNEYSSIEEYLQSDTIKGELWNYILKKDLIERNNVKFIPGVKFAEDRNFVIKYLSCINSFQLINECFYNYRENELSAMKSKKNISDSIDHLLIIEDIIEFYNQSKVARKDFIQQNVISVIKMFFSFTSISGFNKNELSQIKNEYINVYKQTLITFLSHCPIQIKPMLFYLNIIYYKMRLS